MAGPKSMVFALNGTSPAGPITLPDVGPNDLIGAPMFPSRDYFVRPSDIQSGQKMTIRLHPEHPLFGQAFGYVAPKGQCILDFNPDECWIVPTSPSGYNFAHQGETILADGSVLETANIGGGAGHAGEHMGWQQVPFYYENTSSQMTAVRYGEDDYGVYAAGVAVPTMTWGQVLEFMRSATSGDWRWVDKLQAFDFMGSCLVNLPGLPLFDGTRVVRKASATILQQDRAMLVTFNGAEFEGTDDMGTSATAAKTACACGGITANADPGAAAPVAMDSAAIEALVNTRVTEAIEATNAAWETKLADAFAPVNARLDEWQPLVLSLLDRV